MPEDRTQNYYFGGLQTVLIYTETEMAKALGLTRRQLRKRLEKGGIGLSYHAHPRSNPEQEYQFNESSFKENIAKWECVKDNGGHQFEFDHYYDERQKKAVWQCKNCPAQKYD